MKSIRRLTVLTGTVVVAGTLLSPSAFAATTVTPYTGSVGQGGDHGYGNCGYNNGGAVKFAGPTGSRSSGLGGFRQGDTCRIVVKTGPIVEVEGAAEGAPVVVAPLPDVPVDGISVDWI